MLKRIVLWTKGTVSLPLNWIMIPISSLVVYHGSSMLLLVNILTMHVLFFLYIGELLLNRQVKSYKFLSGGEVSIDNVDDAEEFKNTWVCKMIRNCSIAGYTSV